MEAVRGLVINEERGEDRVRTSEQGVGQDTVSFDHIALVIGGWRRVVLRDYRLASPNYYLPDGSTQQVPIRSPNVPIAETFDAASGQQAICDAQRDRVMYLIFMWLTRAAGCVGYFMWINGRHVT